MSHHCGDPNDNCDMECVDKARENKILMLHKEKRLRSDDDHALALVRINELWEAQPETIEYEELERLVELVEAYEEKRWPINRKGLAT